MKMNGQMRKYISLFLAAAVFFSVALTGCGEKAVKKPGVMIYEVYTSGGYSGGNVYAPYKNCYVVLYNASDVQVDLTGWTLKYCVNNSQNATPTKTTLLENTIGPKQFYVIEGGLALDAKENIVGDELGFEVNVKNDKLKPARKSGIFALCNVAGQSVNKIASIDSFVEDYFAYCDLEENETTMFEGKGPATGSSVSKVFRRVAFADTDDNQADFETKNIAETPVNIIKYTKTMTSDELLKRPPARQAEVKFSAAPGYYSKEFNLELTTDLTGDYKIYYTTDGSVPVSPTGKISEKAVVYDPAKKIRIYDRTGEHTNLMDVTGLQPEGYNDPKTSWPPLKLQGETDAAYKARTQALYDSVYKGNVICAAAVSAEGVTPVQSGSFFVSAASFESRFNLPVVSIIIDKAELFDPELGLYIYKNIEERSDAFKRPARLQFFEKDGKLAFEEQFRFGLNGGYTRVLPQKSIRINMSDESFNYDLFLGKSKDSAGKTITYFDRFILRSGGNDWQNGSVRDAFWQNYCSQLGSFDTQANRQCIAFINGEFWGIYYITERQDEYYVSSKYNMPKEDVTIVEGFFSLQAGISPDEKALQDLRTFVIENDMSKDENYKRFTDLIDVDSYVDYFICELYCGNTDWPHNNLKLWRNRNTESDKNQKWRLMMQDVDFAFTSVTGPDHDPMNWIMNESKRENSYMFKSLLNNVAFRNKFISRFETLLNEFFVKEKMMVTLNEIKAGMEAAVVEHRARWNLNNMEAYYGTYTYIENFITIRNDTIRQSLAKVKQQFS